MQWTGSIEFGWQHQWLLICRWILATPHILFALFVLPVYATYTHCTQFSVSQSYRRMAFNVINIAGFAAHTIRNNVIHARAKKQKCEIIFLMIPVASLDFTLSWLCTPFTLFENVRANCALLYLVLRNMARRRYVYVREHWVFVSLVPQRHLTMVHNFSIKR